MKQSPPNQRAEAAMHSPEEPARKPVIIVISILLLVCAAGAIFLSKRTKSPTDAAATDQTQGQGSKTSPANDEAVETTGAAAGTQQTPTAMVAPTKRHTPVVENTTPRVEPSPATRQLVSSLTGVDFSQGPMTPQKAADWKQNLQQLTSQGTAAVPAIREFLEKNLDVNYDPATGGLLGQSSLRLSLLETLQTIGGAEAIDLSSQILQTTLDPREIAWLAQSLDQQAPGQYAQMAADAAREALAAATGGQLEGRDVGPLFGVLQQYGGEEVADELENFASQYRYYATIALANLPEGAGVSTLVQMVQDPDALSKGGRAPALQMLAQAALEHPEALQALLEQSRLGQIPSSTWINIAAILAGDRTVIGSAPVGPGVRSFHLANGNQNFYTLPDHSQWPPEQLNRYISIVQQLLAGNTNPTAITALQNTLAALQARNQP